MKYLKTYESSLKYNVGDYVIVDSEWLYYIGKIVSVWDDYYIGEFYQNININIEEILRVDDKDIIRKATPEEVEKFKLLKITNKYNI